MKIAFMGTPDFAVPSLARLIESEHEVVLVVTQPSKPKGRGRKIEDPPVKQLADASGLEVIQPKSLKREPLEERIRGLGVDVIAVTAYGKLLPDALLEAPRIGCINVHASLLPEYRGAAPIQRAIMDGRLETGVTIMKIVSELDSGPIIVAESLEIHTDDDAQSLSDMLSVLGADLLLRALDDVEDAGVIEAVEQDHEAATFAPMIRKADGEVDWSMTAEQLMFRMRALTPWPGLYTNFGERRERRVRLVEGETLGPGEAEHNDLDDEAAPGTVTGVVKGFGFAVQTGDGHLLLTRVQPAGKALMDAPAFLNGYRLGVGDTLGPELD